MGQAAPLGAEPWLRAIPNATFTATDLPAVLATTRRAVSSAGLNLQFDYLAGDVFESDLGADAYDLTITGNFCHLFDATQTAAYYAGSDLRFGRVASSQSWKASSESDSIAHCL